MRNHQALNKNSDSDLLSTFNWIGKPLLRYSADMAKPFKLRSFDPEK